MKKIYLFRGAPGAGKSTLVKEIGLENYTLSADFFRMAFQSPVLTEDGVFQINQSYASKESWAMLHKALEKRMQYGNFVIVDATHSKVSELFSYRTLADKYKYEIVVVDFTSVPIEVAKEQNLKREEYKQVPETVIDRMYARFKTEKVPVFMKSISYKDAQSEIQLKPVDMSCYSMIHHIGDIHGCYTALKSYLKEGINPNHYYIFTGDYIDRGIENGETITYLMSLMDLPNVCFLEGNHENHLWNWANGERAKSLIFENDTKKQLESYGVSRKEVKRFCRKLRTSIFYKYQEKEVLVTHGGLSKIPKNLHLVSAEQCIRGVGDYKTQIDDIFNEKEQDKNRYQVHGHRNFGLRPYTPGSRSFNLEGAVDSGGHLRTIRLGQSGFQSVQVKNEVYRRELNHA